MSDVKVSINNIMESFNWGKDMLQQPNLTWKMVIEQRMMDQSATVYKKHCFYCHRTFETSRTSFINHLFQHGFWFGRSNRLVYIERLVNIVQDLFLNYRCLYCLDKFDTTFDLITHMNDKQHNGINPDNAFFDQFYIINYFHKKSQKSRDVKVECAINHNDHSVELTPTATKISCLFCKHIFHGIEGFKLHCTVFHQFNFDQLLSQFPVDDQIYLTKPEFYVDVTDCYCYLEMSLFKIKAVKFIRGKVSKLTCILCNEKFVANANLLEHMEIEDHYKLPHKSVWGYNKYSRSRLDNDKLVQYLQDPDDQRLANGCDALVGDSDVIDEITEINAR